jgi:uncharacterized protein
VSRSKVAGRHVVCCSRRDVLTWLLSASLAPAAAFATVRIDRHTRLVIDAAIAQTKLPVTYDGSYRRIAYPGGDVPRNIGVCTDVIIRAYRAIDVDLQQLVHEDMRVAFAQYPKIWGALKPDPNIDHRRVPNLQVFFRRHGAALPPSQSADRYIAGDLVSWMLPGNLPHIGLVSDQRSRDGRRPMIIHNIGRGPEIEDALFAYRITGHYRFQPLEA